MYYIVQEIFSARYGIYYQRINENNFDNLLEAIKLVEEFNRLEFSTIYHVMEKSGNIISDLQLTA